MKNPHNHLTHSKDENGKFIDHWTCEYCKQEGTFDEMNEPDALHAGVEYKECTHVYPPCDSCGQTPTCAHDCRGTLEAVHSLDNVYISGDGVASVH